MSLCVGTYFFKFQANEQDHLKGINVYIALLFSPVPFTGCLRAYRFHFTSLFPKDPCIICLHLFFLVNIGKYTIHGSYGTYFF